MLQQVVQPGVGNRLGVALEPGNSGAGHLELANLSFDGRYDDRGSDLQRRGGQVSVEEEMKVLIGRDSTDQFVTGLTGGVAGQLLAERPASVAMGDACGELLQGDVHKAVDR